MQEMQAPFFENQEFMKAFRETLSESRFNRYLRDAKDDQKKAIRLYQWNSVLSQSMYLPLQAWEIALRNRMNAFLCWKYKAGWPYDDRALRQLKGHARDRLREAIDRQKRTRGIDQVPTDMLVADLPAGFWVSLLSSSYDVPFSYRYNIRKVFPHSAAMDREKASTLCGRLLDLRNRVAHHEPIYHLPLKERRSDLSQLLEAMCPGSYAYVTSACTLDSILRNDPRVIDFQASGMITLALMNPSSLPASSTTPNSN